MSKRNHIVERASDVNGGQYIQTNPSYNSGYEDGKKAGKEYCASEITTLREQVKKLKAELKSIDGALDDPRANLTLTTSEIIWELKEQVEKLTKERDDLRSRRCEVCGYLEHEREHTGCLREQLAALAEQNEKLKEATNLIYSWANNWDSEFMNDPDLLEQDYPFIQSTISLPNLATPVLNRIRAEGMRMAAEILIDPMDRAAAQKICAQADELEQSK